MRAARAARGRTQVAFKGGRPLSLSAAYGVSCRARAERAALRRAIAAIRPRERPWPVPLVPPFPAAAGARDSAISSYRPPQGYRTLRGTVAPMHGPGADRAVLEAACAELDAPFAVVDLDAFDANADDLVRRAAGTPIRLASKSIRCRTLMMRAREHASGGFRGILAFTLPEALWLAGLGEDDLLVAYPSTDRAAFAELAALAGRRPGVRLTVMVDDPAQLDLIERAIPPDGDRIRVCLDLDIEPEARRRAGPDRGPSVTESIRRSRPPASRARSCAGNGSSVVGVMGYEAQVAGVGDRPAGRPLRGAAIRGMQALAMRDSASAAPRSSKLCARSRRWSSSTAAAPAASRQTAAEDGRDGGRRRLGSLRAVAVRRLLVVHAPPGGAVRPAGRPPPGPRRGHGARRRLPRLGRGGRRPAARAPPPLRACVSTPRRARARSRRRCSAPPPTASRSATASGSATRRPASCASASMSST